MTKHYFYIDNFRGFSNTRIPITDVNFLVGENSTGKTSVLGLMKLLSGTQFLMSQDFGDEDVNFGHFSDMVSAHADDKTYFRIGVAAETVLPTNSNKSEPITTGYLLTFTERDGLPQITRFTFSRGVEKVAIRFRGNAAYYKREQYGKPPTVEELITDFLPAWKAEHETAGEGYTRLVLPSGFPGRMPTLILLSLVWNQPKAGTKDSERFSLNFPSMGLPPDLIWLAPIRTKPRRTYDELSLDFSPEGAHTPYLIRGLLRRKKIAASFRALIDKIGQASGLFQDVRIKNFGRGITAPFELDVVLDGQALNLSTVGYGVSQSLPVLVEVLARDHATWFAIQQPEVHLHPRAQAVLGDLFFDMAKNEHKRFLIETHSDFMIDRFRMRYKEREGEQPDSQILFFERRDNHNVVTSLPIGEKGELPIDQPKNYRDFFIREEMRLLEI